MGNQFSKGVSFIYYFDRLGEEDNPRWPQILTVLRAKVVQERFEALERCVAAVAVGIAVGNAGRQAVAVMAERLMGISVGASASDAAIAAINAINAAAAVVAVRDGSELHLKRAYRRRLGCCCRWRRC